MNDLLVKNLTGEPVEIIYGDGENDILVIDPSGPQIRVDGPSWRQKLPICGKMIVTTSFEEGELNYELPPQKEGTIYIASIVVAEYCGRVLERTDVYAPAYATRKPGRCRGLRRFLISED